MTFINNSCLYYVNIDDVFDLKISKIPNTKRGTYS